MRGFVSVLAIVAIAAVALFGVLPQDSAATDCGAFFAAPIVQSYHAPAVAVQQFAVHPQRQFVRQYGFAQPVVVQRQVIARQKFVQPVILQQQRHFRAVQGFRAVRSPVVQLNFGGRSGFRSR